MFTPFYSPDFNAIENVNSIIKNNTNELILEDYINTSLTTNIKKEQLEK
jgi:transposase